MVCAVMVIKIKPAVLHSLKKNVSHVLAKTRHIVYIIKLVQNSQKTNISLIKMKIVRLLIKMLKNSCYNRN